LTKTTVFPLFADDYWQLKVVQMLSRISSKFQILKSQVHGIPTH